jgi:hypothetical protein
MRYLLIILLFFSFSLKAQLREPIKTIALYSSCVILEAIGDGLYDNGEKIWGHAMQAVSTGLLVASPFILKVEKNNWYWYLMSYTFLRISLFDPTYNLTRGLPPGYTGNTSVWDKGMQKLKPPEGMKLFGHSVFFIIGISIPLNEL